MEALRKIVSTVKGPLGTSVTAGIVTHLGYEQKSVDISGIPVPTAIVAAGAAFIGSRGSDMIFGKLIAEYAASEVSDTEFNITYEALNSLGTGLTMAGVFYLLGARGNQLMKPLVIGGLSELASNYVEKTLLGSSLPDLEF